MRTRLSLGYTCCAHTAPVTSCRLETLYSDRCGQGKGKGRQLQEGGRTFTLIVYHASRQGPVRVKLGLPDDWSVICC
jgi:hypothetical protein